MRSYPELSQDIRDKLAYARRLQWWTLVFRVTVVALMYLTLGSSQAMRTAWIEDLLSSIPPVLFLISTAIETRPPTRRYPYGFHRVGSLTFFLAACTLAATGALLTWESAASLIRQDHPTIGSFRVWGHDIWLGWAMIAVLVYSAIPPFFLGRMKKKVGQPLADKVLETDADMNKADWRTACAGVLGILGIYIGLWWADAVAALAIALSVLKDGLYHGRVAVAELVDGAPRELDSPEIDPTAERILARLEARYPDADIRIRQTGRFIRACISPDPNRPASGLAEDLAGAEAWRLIEVSHQIEEDIGAPKAGAKAGSKG